MKWKSVFPHVQKNKKKKWKALSAVLAAVLCMTAAAPAAELHAEEGPAGYVRSVYTNEWVPAAQAASRPIAIMMPTDKAAQRPTESAMPRYCMKSWRKGIFPVSLPSLMTGRGFPASEI